MSNLKSRNHDYNLDGVDIHIRNFPRADTHANLLPTAEAWLNYAKQAYGKGVVDFTATWGENGVVSVEDIEPLNILQVLRDNGVNVEQEGMQNG